MLPTSSSLQHPGEKAQGAEEEGGLLLARGGEGGRSEDV